MAEIRTLEVESLRFRVDLVLDIFKIAVLSAWLISALLSVKSDE